MRRKGRNLWKQHAKTRVKQSLHFHVTKTSCGKALYFVGKLKKAVMQVQLKSWSYFPTKELEPYQPICPSVCFKVPIMENQTYLHSHIVNFKNKIKYKLVYMLLYQKQTNLDGCNFLFLFLSFLPLLFGTEGLHQIVHPGRPQPFYLWKWRAAVAKSCRIRFPHYIYITSFKLAPCYQSQIRLSFRPK